MPNEPIDHFLHIARQAQPGDTVTMTGEMLLAAVDYIRELHKSELAFAKKAQSWEEAARQAASLNETMAARHRTELAALEQRINNVLFCADCGKELRLQTCYKCTRHGDIT